MFFRFVIAGTLSLGFVAALSAQEQGPKDFYPPDYVNQDEGGPGSGQGQTTPPRGGSPRPSASSVQPAATSNPYDSTTQRAGTGNAVVAPTPVPKTRYDSLPRLPLSKIISVGVVLDATNAEYTKARYLDFLEYAASKRLSISRVFFLGPPSWLQLSDMIVLQSFGTWFESSANLPPKVQIERTPSWIIETENGTVILDGLDNFEQFITEDNKLSLSK